jgi:hypothetical protein
MAETAILGEDVDVIQGAGSDTLSATWSAMSWIAGALAALAVSFLVIALGAGIGLAVASPYGSGPSAGTLTIAGAIWMVFAQSIGFAAGGFVAGRLRTDIIPVPTEEGRFRDGAHGLVAWAIGALVTTSIFAAVAATSAATIARTGAALAGGAAEASRNESSAIDPISYFVDSLIRTNPSRAGVENGNAAVPRDQVTRIVLNAISQGRLADDDKAYLAQIVASHTGMSNDEAQRRVDDVINRARETVRDAADKARKAGEYLSFWTFMSLLFGAVAAVLGGLLGGERRDEASAAQALLAPR